MSGYRDEWQPRDRPSEDPYRSRYPPRDDRPPYEEDRRGGYQPAWDAPPRGERPYGYGGNERDFNGGSRYDDYNREPPPPRRDEYSYPPPRRAENYDPYRPPPQGEPYYDPHQQSRYPPRQQPEQQQWPRGGHDQAPSFQPPPSDNRSGFQGHPPPPRQVNTEPPSASVVLLGIPPGADDLALRHFLEDLGASIDSTTVIRDRATGLSKRYGFAKFSSVEHARAFVEPNFPVITWRERGGQGQGPDDGMKVRINFSQKTGGWREDQGAGARMTEDQRKASEATQAPLSFYVNDGTRDIGSAPTQILLLRGLDPLTSEEDIIASLGAMVGRPGNEIREGSGVKKVLITKDRASRTSWGYAFVQFADVRLATEVLATAFNPHLYPTGYRIRKSIVAISFCHENSFVPIYARSEWSFKGEGGQQLAYWDDKAFVNAWVPTVKGAGAIEAPPAPAKAKVEDESDADMDAFFSSIEADAPKPAAPEAAPATTTLEPTPSVPFSPPVAPLFQSAPAPSLALAAPGAPGAISIKLKTGAIADEEKLKTSLKARKQKEADESGPAAAAAALQADKKKGELIQSKKAARNINHWNTKQQELKAPEGAPDPTPTVSTPAPAPAVLTNLKNESTVRDARLRKVNSLKPQPPAPAADPASSPKYVDRAAARRENHGQPDHPLPESKRRKLAADGPPAPAPPPVQPNQNGIAEDNRGAKMLGNMGWAQGEGLGSSGNGIVAPIQASQFQQGAGLGATKGTVVGEYSTGPVGYKEQLRDKARARMEEASKGQ